MHNSILPIMYNDEFIGTGFCIHYSEEKKKSYILTCYHVLDNVEQYTIYGKKPELIVANKCYDMTIVAISKKMTPLPLVVDSNVSKVLLYSYQEFSNGCIAEEVNGNICFDTISATQYNKECEKSIESQRLEIVDDKAVIQRGNSGSPVICKDTQKVIAIVNIQYDTKKAEKAFALSIRYLKEIWKDVPLDLIKSSTLQELIPFSQQKETFSDSVQSSIFNYSEDEFMACAEEYISNKVYLLKIEAESTIKDRIISLYESSQKEDLASILHDLLDKSELNEFLQKWIDEHYNQDNEKNVKEKERIEHQEERIYVVMRYIKALSYEVTISPRYTEGKNKQSQFLLEDIGSTECQAKFIEKFGRVKRNVSIHLIIPEELYLKNIRLWTKGTRTLLNLSNPLYLHTAERYYGDTDDYSWMIEEWKDIFSKEKPLSDSLSFLKSDDCSFDGKDENDNDLLGVCYGYQPTDEKKISDFLYFAYVSLWSHDTQTEYQKKIIDEFDKITIGELPQKVKKCQHLSLLWDDMSMLENFKRELE